MNSLKNFFLKHFDFSKKEWLFFLIALLAGTVLRAMLFFSTDLTWDEAFHIMLAFKFGALFLEFPIIFFGLLIGAALFVYLVLVKQNVFFAAIFSLIPVLAVFVIGLPITFHPTHPPFFNLFEGALIAITGLGPEVLGKLISSASMLLLAFSGFFLAKHLSGKKAGLLVFALVMLSPYSVFYSAATYITPLADSLAFFALALLFFGLEKNSKLIPFSGFFFALAIFTRYTTLMILLPAVILIYLNRKKILQKENRQKFVIFSLLVVLTVVSLLPAIFSGFNNFLNWGDNNTANLYIRDMVHYSSFLVDQFGSHPIEPSYFFFPVLFSAFYTAILPIVFLAATVFFLKQKKKIPLIFVLLFFAYFAFYSAGQSFQDPNYLLEMEFPLLLVSGLFLAELKPKKLGTGIAAILLFVFLVQGFFLVTAHNFTGLSDTVEKIPEEKIIMTDFIDPVRYYQGEYLFDKKINNKGFLFLEKLFSKQIPDPPESTIISYRAFEENPQQNIDYAILTEHYFLDNFENKFGFVFEERFEKCFEVKSGEYTAFLVFAKNSELCGEIN